MINVPSGNGQTRFGGSSLFSGKHAETNRNNVLTVKKPFAIDLQSQNTKLAISVLAAEVVGTFVAVKTLDFLEDGTPGLWNGITGVIEKIIRPHIKADKYSELEQRLDKLHHLQVRRNHVVAGLPDPGAHPEEGLSAADAKAKKIAGEIAEYGVLFLVGEPTRALAQKGFDTLLNLPKQQGSAYVKARIADRAVSTVLFGAINFIGPVRRQTEALEDAVTKILTNAGMKEPQAENFAKVAINMQIPNFAGMVSNFAVLKSSMGHGR
jgi:hypothetical protein